MDRVGRNTKGITTPFPKSIYEGNGTLYGKRIPFFLLFQESKDVSVNHWINLANLDLMNLDNNKKNSKLVNFLLSKNVCNQWLSSSTMTQVVQLFIKSKCSASSLTKVKLPHPKFNNFNSRFVKTKQKYVIEHKNLRDHQVIKLGLEISAKHNKYYGSAIQNVLPILEQSTNTRFYRLHPIWLLLLKFKFASRSLIPRSCLNLNIFTNTHSPSLSTSFQPLLSATSQSFDNSSMLSATSQSFDNSSQSFDNSPILSATSQSFDNSPMLSATSQYFDNSSQSFDNSPILSATSQSFDNSSMLSATSQSFDNSLFLSATSQSVDNSQLLSATSQSFDNSQLLSATSQSFDNSSMLSATSQSFDNSSMISATSQSFDNSSMISATSQSFDNSQLLSETSQSFDNSQLLSATSQSFDNSSMISATSQYFVNSPMLSETSQMFFNSPLSPENSQSLLLVESSCEEYLF
jgi:hypothetical protein